TAFGTHLERSEKMAEKPEIRPLFSFLPNALSVITWRGYDHCYFEHPVGCGSPEGTDLKGRDQRPSLPSLLPSRFRAWVGGWLHRTARPLLASACRSGARWGLGLARGGREDRSRKRFDAN